jgi:hypothetical protein
MILFKKQLFDLEVKGQGPKKVIMVCHPPPNILGCEKKKKIPLVNQEKKKKSVFSK